MKTVYTAVGFGFVINPKFWATLEENNDFCSLLDEGFFNVGEEFCSERYL